MKKIIAISILAIVVSTSAKAQENPLRIGLKIGVPNVVGLNLEYVTPIMNGKFAPTIDFSFIPITIEDVDLKFTYFEIGTNIYFKKPGKGLYGHISYGRIGFDGTYVDAEKGEGQGQASFNLANFKIGAKLGNSFYFRTEIGYGLIFGDTSVDVEYKEPNSSVITVEAQEIPGIISGGFVVNLGFGVAF
ncbi:MAG: hypothetical protein JXR51_08005 [Bacteroidales bacterium]|nr:hypothetical protein [Bacteroidales bacterium]MBN2757104.1 hypothetical protein [Bacteroidales bacterium]